MLTITALEPADRESTPLLDRTSWSWNRETAASRLLGRRVLGRGKGSECLDPQDQYPEGTFIDPVELPYDVHDCWAAAIARNIELGRELKTLTYLNVRTGRLIVFNLPGDRSIPRHLLPRAKFRRATKQDVSTVFSKNLQSGQFNPWEIMWNAKVPVELYFCRHIWRYYPVCTNAGTLRSTLIIEPNTLRTSFRNWKYFDSVA